MEALTEIDKNTECDDRQIRNLIRVDYFKGYGNQAQLLKLYEIYCYFKRGKAKSIKKQKLRDGPLKDVIMKYSTDCGVNGNTLKSYTITDICGLLNQCELYIRSLEIPDISIKNKINDQLQLLGYIDLTTNRPSDRKKLVVLDTYNLKGKDGVIWGVAINVRSIGTGKEARLTVRSAYFDKHPIKKMDVILCTSISKNKRGYWYLNSYQVLF